LHGHLSKGTFETATSESARDPEEEWSFQKDGRDTFREAGIKEVSRQMSIILIVSIMSFLLGVTVGLKFPVNTPHEQKITYSIDGKTEFLEPTDVADAFKRATNVDDFIKRTK
jgi:hypothetical protein